MALGRLALVTDGPVLDFGFLAAQLVIYAEAMNLLVRVVTVPEWIAILGACLAVQLPHADSTVAAPADG